MLIINTRPLVINLDNEIIAVVYHTRPGHLLSPYLRAICKFLSSPSFHIPKPCLLCSRYGADVIHQSRRQFFVVFVFVRRSLGGVYLSSDALTKYPHSASPLHSASFRNFEFFHSVICNGSPRLSHEINKLPARPPFPFPCRVPHKGT